MGDGRRHIMHIHGTDKVEGSCAIFWSSFYRCPLPLEIFNSAVALDHTISITLFIENQ